MSTKAITTVLNSDGQPICHMYRHWDGGPKDHGAELSRFLSGLTLFHGATDRANAANGMEEVAAKMVAHFKNLFPNGTIYLMPDDTGDIDYTYTVRCTKDDDLIIEITQHDD